MPLPHTSTGSNPWIENFKSDEEAAAPARFPKEFAGNFWENLDRRFFSVLVTSFLFNVLPVLYLLEHPPQSHVKHVEAVQERFARMVLDKDQTVSEIMTETLQPAPLDEEAEQAASASNQAVSTNSGHRSGARTGGQTVADDQAAGPGRAGGTAGHRNVDVGRAGILGLLSSSSDRSGGEAVADILGEGSIVSDMDKALSAGLARAGSGGGEQLQGELGSGPGGGSLRGVRGGRETGGGNIDAMVEGLGEGTAKGVARTGELVIRNEEPLIEAEEGGTGSGRSQDEVAAIVARHTAAIQSCYQSELRRNPNLQGKLVVRFVISPQGMVESVTVVSSTLNNDSVERCVVNRIRRWDDFGAIDPKRGKMTIRQVYTFGY
ncbi:MAG: TonB family protein [bacterium]